MMKFETLYNPEDIVFMDLDTIRTNQWPTSGDDRLSASDRQQAYARATNLAGSLAHDKAMWNFQNGTINSIETILHTNIYDTMTRFYSSGVNNDEQRIVLRLRMELMKMYMSSTTAQTIIIKSHLSNWKLKIHGSRRLEKRPINLAKIVAKSFIVNMIPATIYCVPAYISYKDPDDADGSDIDTCYAVLCMTPTAAEHYTNVMATYWDSISDEMKMHFAVSKNLYTMFINPGAEMTRRKYLGEKYLHMSEYNPETLGIIDAKNLLTDDHDTRQLKEFIANINETSTSVSRVRYIHMSSTHGVDNYFNDALSPFGLLVDTEWISILDLVAPTCTTYRDPDQIADKLLNVKKDKQTFTLVCENGKEYANLISTYVKMINEASSMSPETFNRTFYGC